MSIETKAGGQVSTPDASDAGRSFTRILGIKFYAGAIEGLMELTRRGGLVAVPSAPVLVDLKNDEAHRQAVEGCDFAITDSGFMVWLWWLFGRGKLERISGLKYIRALMEDREFREPGATFWVMPSQEDAYANMAWLQKKGLKIRQADMYVAPMYPKNGAIEDAALLAAIDAHKPRFVVMCLGGGVQERLGFFIRRSLKKKSEGDSRLVTSDSDAEVGSRIATTSDTDLISNHKSLVTAGDAPEGRMPAIICTGAAIAFLSGRQANIPPWADKLILGWLFRCLSEPTKFIPRYWRSMKLIPILWRYGARSVASDRLAS